MQNCGEPQGACNAEPRGDGARTPSERSKSSSRQAYMKPKPVTHAAIPESATRGPPRDCRRLRPRHRHTPPLAQRKESFGNDTLDQPGVSFFGDCRRPVPRLEIVRRRVSRFLRRDGFPLQPVPEGLSRGSFPRSLSPSVSVGEWVPACAGMTNEAHVQQPVIPAEAGIQKKDLTSQAYHFQSFSGGQDQKGERTFWRQHASAFCGAFKAPEPGWRRVSS